MFFNENNPNLTTGAVETIKRLWSRGLWIPRHTRQDVLYRIQLQPNRVALFP